MSRSPSQEQRDSARAILKRLMNTDAEGDIIIAAALAQAQAEERERNADEVRAQRAASDGFQRGWLAGKEAVLEFIEDGPHFMSCLGEQARDKVKPPAAPAAAIREGQPAPQGVAAAPREAGRGELLDVLAEWDRDAVRVDDATTAEVLRKCAARVRAALAAEPSSAAAGQEEGLREALRKAVGLMAHDVANFMTGEHEPDCRACALARLAGQPSAAAPVGAAPGPEGTSPAHPQEDAAARIVHLERRLSVETDAREWRSKLLKGYRVRMDAAEQSASALRQERDALRLSLATAQREAQEAREALAAWEAMRPRLLAALRCDTCDPEHPGQMSVLVDVSMPNEIETYELEPCAQCDGEPDKVALRAILAPSAPLSTEGAQQQTKGAKP